MAHIPQSAQAKSENIANNPTLSLVVRKGGVGNIHLAIPPLLPNPTQMLPLPAGAVRGLLLLGSRL